MTAASGADPALLRGWLEGRSLARGLPAPVADRGGFRVDTGSEVEVVRWVFAQAEPGIGEIARTIAAPRHLLKLCGTGEELLAMLPAGWVLAPPAWFMTVAPGWMARPLAAGYELEIADTGPVRFVRIRAADGTMAAATRRRREARLSMTGSSPRRRIDGAGWAAR